MKITEDPWTGLRGLTEEDSPAEDSIKEKEIGGTDPGQDPPEEISAETILSQDSEERVLIKNTTKEIQGKIREETDRDLEIDKDPHQLETTHHHPRQEDPILHFPQKKDSSPFQRKSRSQNYGNNRRRSFSGSSASRDSSFPRRNRDRRGNSGSRNNSPANHQRKDSAKYNKVSYCSACGSNTHTQNSCFRYPETSKVTEPCSYCLKNGRRLYHQYQYCCYRESKYKSPNRNGSKN